MSDYRFAVRVKPGAAKEVVGGCHPGPHGPALIVAVTAPAVDGRANEALRKALAGTLNVRRADIGIAVGARGRDKIVVVEASPDRLAKIIDQVTNLRDK